MVLPAGTRLPPPLHGAVVLVAVLAVGWRLRRADPRLSPRTVAALAPWMVAGAALYVVEGLGVPPPWLAPVVSSPTVYLTTAAVAGAVWLATLRAGAPVEATLAVSGTLAAAAVAAAAVGRGLAAGTVRPLPSLLALVVATGLAAAVWSVLRRLRSGAAAATAEAGALVVFAHAVDGVSTAVGVDWLGFGERTPLSALILDVGAALPTAPHIGSGWLFVVVKLALAAGVVLLLADYVREEPGEGLLVLALVAAVGLGPGFHNLLLFAVSGG